MRVKIRPIYFYLIIPLLVISWVTVVNRFPVGYTFFAGDYAQPINIQQLFKNLPYVWNGRIAASAEGGFFSWFSAIPFYFVFYLLPSKLGLSDTQILSYLLFSFLSLYYLSFLLALKILFRKGDLVFNALFSLVYALNPMTLYFFTYAWGPSHQVFLYAFIPTLISLFIRAFETLQIKYIVLFLIVLFLSIPAYTNSAFALALFIHLFLVFLLASLLRLVPVGPRSLKGLARNLVLIFFGSLPILSYWLLPTLVFVREGISRLAGGRVFDLFSWLSTQSSSLPSIFLSVPQYVNYYPFKYEGALFSSFAFIPIFLLVFALLRKNYNSRKRRLLLLFSVSYFVFSFLVKKVEPPFSSFSLWLFKLPLLPALRSYEKVAIFLPFSLLMPGYIFATSLSSKRGRWLVLLALLLALVAVRPYFTGGIQTKYSIAFPKGKDYRTAEYSILTRIPDDYYELAAVSDKNVTDTKIQSMPFSPLNSISWVNYPRWKMIGTDPIEMVFSKNILSSNSSIYVSQGWHPHSFFSISTLDPRWYTRMLSFFDVSEILYHKDVDDRFIPQSLPKVMSLEEKGLVSVVKETDSAILYEKEDSLVLPHFYVPRNLVFVGGGVERLPSVLSFDDYEIRSGIYLAEGPQEIRKLGNSEILERADEVFVVGKRIRPVLELLEPEWRKGWAWPEANISPESWKYPLVRLKEQWMEWRAKEPLEKADVLLWHGCKRIEEIKKFAPQEGTEIGKLGDLYLEKVGRAVEILQSVPEKERDEEFWGMVGKALAYTGRVEEDIREIEELHNGFREWVEDIADLWGEDEYHYEIEIPKDGEYEVFLGGEDVEILNTGILDIDGEELRPIAERGEKNWVGFGRVRLGKGRHVWKLEIPLTEVAPGEESEEEEVPFEPKMVLRTVDELTNNELTGAERQIPKITFTKVNPTKYRVKIEGAKDPYTLIFSESFHKGWKVYKVQSSKPKVQSDYGEIVASYFDGDIKEGTHRSIFLEPATFETWGKRPVEADHLLVNGYANSWYIKPEDVDGAEDYELIVEFWPQRLFYVGLFVSLTALLGCLVYLGYDFTRRWR